MRDYFIEVLENVNSKNRVLDNNFQILMPENYKELLTNNYKVPQLKKMSKHYGLKQSGNKRDLTYNLYNHLRLCKYATEIQRWVRGHLLRRYNSLHGPAFRNRAMCTNTQDFFTMEDITTIPQFQFFSFTDDDGFIYGFDILSLHNLYVKSNSKAHNPFNRKEISEDTIKNLYQLIKLTHLLKFPLQITIDNKVDNITPKKRLELRIVSLFQRMDELGNYTDPKWFSDLSHDKIVLFIRELYDIWNYRAQLSNEMKIQICPPSGNPFHGVGLIHINNLPFYHLQNLALGIIQNLIKNEANDHNNNTGVMYVLSALCLVHPGAASALPWLYQSVAHTN